MDAHNEREWYHANKKQYQEANMEFENLIQAFIFEIGKTDPSILHNIPKALTFKLVRDTRYSNDKSPYNPFFRAHIAPQGKLPIPVGYFIFIRPDNRSFIGGGLFADMFNDATAMMRDYIVGHGEQWQSIVANKAFMENFKVKGESLKNVPRGYVKEHPQAEYLKNKSWYLEYQIADDLIKDSEKFIKEATEKFVLMQPFNSFINQALKDFQMPERP